MILLQEAIMGGMIIMILIGIAFLIGVPLIVLILKKFIKSSKEEEKMNNDFK